MRDTNRTAGAMILMATVFAFFSMFFMASLGVSEQASAQSSVRPPANATRNVVPGRTPSTGVEAPRVPPPKLKDGVVPGGALGNRSQADIWRKIREGSAGNVSIPDKRAGQLIRGTGNRLTSEKDVIAATQSRGGSAGNLNRNMAGIDSWINVRNGPLLRYGLYAMAGVIALLAVFFLIRGRIRIEHGAAGTTIQRFNSVERIAHWLLAVSFIILALTGLNLLYGREFLIPLMGKETFAAVAYGGKLAHNYVAFAFMLGLAMILLLWIRENIPHPRDIRWLLSGGGLFFKGSHPSAKKFNAGQKILFWLVMLGGISVSLSGIALMFPFETQMFGKTFTFLNGLGASLPAQVSAIEEQQYASLWHSIMALFMICFVIAHIYIGSVGMEGALDAMTTGRVDVNWAREHHDLWAEEAMQQEAEVVRQAVAGGSKVQPAE
ncbi:MAG: formate dehydrogenase subunit gamma [Hyphomicrobiaceae bacterium]